MISFHQFLLEMPSKIDYGFDNRLDKDTTHPDHTQVTHLGIAETGHKIFAKTWDSRDDHGGIFTTYAAHNPKTKKNDVEVNGYQKGKQFKITTLAGRRGSTIKAHKLYAHMAKKGVTVVSSSSHSPGGAKVWHRVSQEPGLNFKHMKPTVDYYDPNPNSKFEKIRHKVKNALGVGLHTSIPYDKHNWDNNYRSQNNVGDSHFEVKKKKWWHRS